MMSQDDEYSLDEFDSSYVEDSVMPSQSYMYDEDFTPAEILDARIEYFDFVSECGNLVQNCMLSVFLQSIQSIQTLLTCCILFRLAVYVVHVTFMDLSSKHYSVLHIFGIFLGCVTVFSIESNNAFATGCIMISYIVISYVFLIVLSKSSYSCSKCTSIFTVVFLIFGESFVQNSELWHQIRGILLLLAMKVISISFDIDNKSIKFPSILSYLSYCMHCGTLLFGPWISYEDFCSSITHPKRFSYSWFFNILKSLICSFACLLLSTCLLSYLFIDGAQPELPSVSPFVANHWMSSYQSAVSFHFSHFYICYLSQVTCMISGIGKMSDKNAVWSNFVVVKPLSVVVPFSMLNLVVDWNIPMSKWLKKYVFNAYKHLGRTTAVLFTYCASAILHGLSFHLAAVLLSLSFLTYVEYTFRRKLSHLLKCPAIQSRPPVTDSKKRCYPWWAVLFNIMWIVINVAHLAYLGSMFQSEDSEIAKQGYHMQHTLTKWRNLGFFSPIFAFVILIVSWILPNKPPQVDTHRKSQ